jgi:hypothetical protein
MKRLLAILILLGLACPAEAQVLPWRHQQTSLYYQQQAQIAQLQAQLNALQAQGLGQQIGPATMYHYHYWMNGGQQLIGGAPSLPMAPSNPSPIIVSPPAQPPSQPIIVLPQTPPAPSNPIIQPPAPGAPIINVPAPSQPIINVPAPSNPIITPPAPGTPMITPPAPGTVPLLPPNLPAKSGTKPSLQRYTSK